MSPVRCVRRASAPATKPRHRAAIIGWIICNQNCNSMPVRRGRGAAASMLPVVAPSGINLAYHVLSTAIRSLLGDTHALLGTDFLGDCADRGRPRVFRHRRHCHEHGLDTFRGRPRCRACVFPQRPKAASCVTREKLAPGARAHERCGRGRSRHDCGNRRCGGHLLTRGTVRRQGARGHAPLASGAARSARANGSATTGECRARHRPIKGRAPRCTVAGARGPVC